MTGFSAEAFTWNSPATPHKVAITSFALGGLAILGLHNALNQTWGYPQIWLYVFFYAVFHMLEFLVTAYYNTPKVDMNSFLLTNGKQYLYATIASVCEALLVHFFWPKAHKMGYINYFGLAFIVLGQVIRTKAMVHAALSFNHKVAFQKQDDHTLVTTGLYASIRHPSYTGFLMWSVGSQLFLGNLICTVAFSTILWAFFKGRIAREEAALVQFFGESYIAYRTKVWSGLPFV